MKKNCFLNSNNTFIWTFFSNINVKGYAFDKDDDFLEGESLANLFSDVNSLDAFEKIVQDLNGLFAVVIESDDAIYLATDITRSYPLFYCRIENGWAVSDNANFLKDMYKLDIKRELEDEFLFAGYMTEDKTLVSEIKQVRAHEVVELSEKKSSKPYFSFASKTVMDSSLPILQKELLNCYKHVGQRLVKALNSRTAVLPLSGGYDSRLVLTLLKEQNYKKIICFSYGTKSSYEVSIAKDVAKAMDVKFINIEYSDKFISSNLSINELVDYEKFAGNLASLPHVQDFLSVKYLKENDLVPEDSVFIPGIAGDIFAGTQIPNDANYKMTDSDILKSIKSKYLNFKPEEFTYSINFCNDCYGYSVIESFCVKEKVPKFVANSIRVYEFLGFKFLLPLMDKELLSFFSNVPLNMKKRNFKNEYKLYENLYDSTNFILFKKYKIDIPKTDSRMFFARYINYFKRRIGLKVDSTNNFDSFIYSLEKLTGLETSFRAKKNINMALSEIYLHMLKKTL